MPKKTEKMTERRFTLLVGRKVLPDVLTCKAWFEDEEVPLSDPRVEDDLYGAIVECAEEDFYGAQLEEFPGCCGLVVISGLGDLNILKVLSLLREAREGRYGMVYATDLAKDKSKAILLAAGFTIDHTFKNPNTGNVLNVYSIAVPREFDYDQIWENLQPILFKPKRVRTKKAGI